MFLYLNPFGVYPSRADEESRLAHNLAILASLDGSPETEWLRDMTETRVRVLRETIREREARMRWPKAV